MVKKIKKRSWPFEKFSAACKARAKRLKVKIDATKLRTAYDGKLSIPHTVETLAKK